MGWPVALIVSAWATIAAKSPVNGADHSLFRLISATIREKRAAAAPKSESFRPGRLVGPVPSFGLFCFAEVLTEGIQSMSHWVRHQAVGAVVG